MKQGFALPAILVLGIVIVGFSILVYFSKSQHKREITFSPTLAPTSTPQVSKLTSSPPIDESCYTSGQNTDREIGVVSGGLNIEDFTPDIRSFINPKIEISKGKQSWMFLQTYKPTKQTNVYSEDNFYHSTLAFAPRNNIAGKCDLVINLLDGSNLKKTLLIRVNVAKDPTGKNVPLPPKDLKAVLIGVGSQDFQQKIASLESAYYEATYHQGKLDIEYLGNVLNSDEDVFNKTDEIIDPFIISKGKSLSDYDLALVHLKNYIGAPRTSSQLKKIVYCCENSVFLHEFIHLASGIGDIAYENTLLPPDPLHYTNFEKSDKFSNPVLTALGFLPQDDGVWVLIDGWGYQTIKGSTTYQIKIRNTGNSKNKFKIITDSGDIIAKAEKAPSSWLELSSQEVDLGPKEETTVNLTVVPKGSVVGKLYGISIDATTLDGTVWDKANIYFETNN